MSHEPEPRARRSGAPAIAVAALLLGVAAGSARCEQLTLRDGSWIEIRGAARSERGRVVFRTVEGNLRSLPLSEIAPAASALAASAAPEEPVGGRLREYPRGAPLVFDAPRVPPPPPLPRRLDAPKLPPGCVLGNARPGDPPALVCVEREPSDPPPSAPAEAQESG